MAVLPPRKRAPRRGEIVAKPDLALPPADAPTGVVVTRVSDAGHAPGAPPSAHGAVYGARVTTVAHGPWPAGEAYTLVAVDGPGTFLSAVISAVGVLGAADVVRLELDGASVLDLSVATAHAMGMRPGNLSGVVVHIDGSGWQVSVGFPYPLGFHTGMRLVVVPHARIPSLRAQVVHAG